MSETSKGKVVRFSAGSVTGVHTERGEFPPVLVAPATDEGFNTVRIPLLPIGCFCLFDSRFAFDSSFVSPDATPEFAHLQTLRLRLKNSKSSLLPPLSLFGHADTSGSDDYNKTLSGRRSRAIFALLTRKAEIWEDLYSHPFGGDNWGLRTAQVMLDALLFDPGMADGVMGTRTREAVKAFQRENGLKDDGDPGQKTRAQLFKAYMDVLCRDEASKPYLLTSEDFLARGEHPQGKGDMQGCADFNPVRVFAQQEDRQFQQSTDKTERNAENAPNRRVLVFLFKPGAKVDPGRWPCPSVSEGAGGCRARFWSDGEKRRRPQEARREYENTQDTFACRFYDRLANGSPCEATTHGSLVRLYDGFGQAIPFAPFAVAVGSEPFSAISTAGEQGTIQLHLEDSPASCRLKWGFPPLGGQSPVFLFERTIFLEGVDGTGAEATRRKLSHLGYDGEDPELNINGFQLDYGFLEEPPLEVTGKMDERTAKLLDQVHAQSAQNLRRTSPA